MTDNTLSKIISTLAPSQINQFFTALTNDLVPRNGLGAPESGKKLGTPNLRWGEVHTTDLYLNGALFDPDNIGNSSGVNAVLSAQTRTYSDLPDFIRAAGSAPSFTIEAAVTPLSMNINSVGVSVSSNLSLGSLNTAPSTENTALINDSTLSGATHSKYAGEAGSVITLDNCGTEITDREGQFVALAHGTSEIIYGRIIEADDGAATATLGNVHRGFFFDDNGDPLVREVMSDNDSLTLLNLAWVFLENNGTTLDVTYRTPSWSFSEPTAPETDDYWYDLANEEWNRWDGSVWEDVNRLHLGWVVMDGTNCIASRSVDFSKNYSDHIHLETWDYTDTTVQSQGGMESVSVYGSLINFASAPAKWDITTDLENGLTESASTFYYLYVTQDGETIISEERPHDRRSDLQGWYHPYESWRYVGVTYNDSGSDLIAANSHNGTKPRIESFTSSGTFYAPVGADIKVICTGGGGGGGGESGYNGGNGSTSSFGSYLSAGGGSRGNGGGSGGSGGSASGGDINIAGGSGMYANTADDIGGNGASSYWGGGGRGGYNTQNGVSGAAYGSGGGGSSDAGNEPGGGGGAGATAIAVLNAIYQETITVTRGGGGSGNGNVYNGGSGKHGIVVVEYL